MAFIDPTNPNSWFEISPYFSFRWVDNNIVSSYNTLPLASTVDDLSYAQPVQCGGDGYQSDTGQIQLTSNYVPTGGLYNYQTNALIKAIDFTPIDPPIANQTFICYNAEIDFSDVASGLYYGKINFTDNASVVHDWRTSPLDVEIYHEGSMLCEATNYINEKGVVFVNSDGSTITIKKRIGSIIRLPIPKSDANDYEDQYNELTQEISVPYVKYTQLLFDPNGFLLPFWEIEKINLLYSLDQVLWDGQPFTKISDSDFKPTRSDIGQQPGWWEVDIQPNNSYPSEQYITGTPPDGDFIVIKKQITFLAQTANFACAGVFNARKNLIRIAVVNNGLEPVTVLLGTSSGDASYGTINLNADATASVDIGNFFKTVGTVWVSGITGANLDVTFDYNDYAATSSTPPTGLTPFHKNTIYYFMEIDVNAFSTAFDISTGLGRVGTDYEGCGLLDGRNGRPNVIGLQVQAWNSLEVLPANTRQTVIGASGNMIQLNTDGGQIPQHFHFVNNTDTIGNDISPGQHIAQGRNQGIKRDYGLAGSSTIPTDGPTSNFPAEQTNGPDPINIQNEVILLPAFAYFGT